MKNTHHILLRTLSLLLAFALLLSCAGCKWNPGKTAEPEEPEEPEEPVVEEPVDDGPVGYTCADLLGEGFIACGSGGRVDTITVDGEVTTLDSGTSVRLNSVFTEDENILIAGDGGTLLMSNDAGASFRKVNCGATGNLNGAAVFNDTMFAAGEEGIIFRQDAAGWKKLQMETNHEIISLAVTNYCIVAVTAETDVYYSEDGEDWEYMNFNEDYDGLYPRYVFTKAVGAGETFFVIGYQAENPELPLIMFTETCQVWMQKEMMKINDEPVTGEENIHIHDIGFNVDQIVGVLDDGRVLSITECSVCNEEMQLDEQKGLWATAVNEKGVLVCGEDFFSRVLGSKQIRQDKIKAEQAREDMQYGALLIDVREADELAESGYIPDSIHIPLAEVEARLPEVAPDHYTEIIFYCASGKRSQKATELAIDMGYQKVYNLGGISDWPYEIVFDSPEGDDAGTESSESETEDTDS